MINTIPIRTQQAGTLPAQTSTTIDIGSITNLMLIMVVMILLGRA